jgi:hypothetical protein
MDVFMDKNCFFCLHGSTSRNDDCLVIISSLPSYFYFSFFSPQAITFSPTSTSKTEMVTWGQIYGAGNWKTTTVVIINQLSR